MKYLEAINQCMKGNKIRSVLMDEGEYIEYCKEEKRLLWWNECHNGHWSYPQDMEDEEYVNWIFGEWKVCNGIRPVNK